MLIPLSIEGLHFLNIAHLYEANVELKSLQHSLDSFCFVACLESRNLISRIDHRKPIIAGLLTGQFDYGCNCLALSVLVALKVAPWPLWLLELPYQGHSQDRQNDINLERKLATVHA